MSNIELKGLSGLKDLDNLLAEVKSEERFEENILNISIDKLISGKYQPRTDFDPAAIHELAKSIQAQGIILPLIVRAINVETFEIIAGERRWRAAKAAGLKAVPVVIRDIPDETALAFSLIENIQRENLNAMDEAVALFRLKDEFSLTHEEIAERVGRSRSTVTNLIRLLTLHDNVKELVRAGKLEMGHGRALLGLSPDKQNDLAKYIVSKHLSVREIEKIINQKKIENKVSSKIISHEWTKKTMLWESQFRKKLGLPVKISFNKNGKGKIQIEEISENEIEQLIEKL